ncbi:MAG TPA: DMT family transporter [Acidimicrobiales bacterium]|nr:DMT family transporter [Acidimicrobiales bacterium]
MLAIGLAVVAAICNAVSSVLERRVDREQPADAALSPRLIGRLLKRPLWLAAMAAVGLGFVAQATALGHGQLSAVQPVLILELPITLVIAARVFGNRLGRREWAAAGAMSAGLALLIWAAAPTGGSADRTSAVGWALGTGLGVGALGACVLLGRRAREGGRAAWWGLAAGIGFGVTAALMKAMDAGFAHGLVGALTRWQTYAMVAVGAAAMFLAQNALQAGRLLAAQPALTLTDPLVAVVWGAALYGERIRTGPWLVAELAGVAAIAWGTVRLVGSDEAASGRDEDQRDPGPDGSVSMARAS